MRGRVFFASVAKVCPLWRQQQGIHCFFASRETTHLFNRLEIEKCRYDNNYPHQCIKIFTVTGEIGGVNKMEYKIALIPGDGIGPEIVAEAKKVLDRVCEKYSHKFSYTEVLLGGASIDAHGVPLTEEAIAQAKASDAVLMGSIGGDAKTSPWYKLEPSKRPEAGLLAIRKALNLFANLRPAYLYNELRDACPLRDEIIGDEDLT